MKQREPVHRSPMIARGQGARMSARKGALMNVRILLMVTGFTVALAIACGGGNERATTIESTVTPITAPDETATIDQTSSTATATPDDDEIAEGLSEALLTLEDMPTGWTVSPPDEDEEDDGDDICGIASGQFAEDAAARETSDFQKSELGPLLNHTIDFFPDGDAKRVMAEFGDALGSCTEWTDIDEDGTETTWRLSPLSFPKIGDETFAFRMSTVTFLGAFELDWILWRRGDVVDVIAHGVIGFEGIDSEQTEAFVRQADEKLKALLQ